MTYDFKKLEDKIREADEWLEKEIASLRTGRAHPALIEEIKIEAYGTVNPLKNVASISVENARTLRVEPWDKTLVEQIEKAIANSQAGVRPAAAKEFIRVNLPELTQERRGQLLKILGEKLEEARIKIRKARDEVWKDIQEKERAKEISKDEKFRLKDQMEDRVKKGLEKLEGSSKRKEKEITE